MSRDDSLGPIGIVVVLFLAVGVLWYITRPERFDECREKCAREGFKSWTYETTRGTCACGGATSP